MTFNRYILFRMVVEFVGAIACAIQMFQHHTWPGIITMGVFALVWAIGEIWLSTVYNRAHPRRDELSDEHQATAIRFTFFVLVVALVVLGFAGMIVTLFRHAPFTVPAMALPTLGMLALAIADAATCGSSMRAGTPMKTSLKFKRMERGLKQADLADLVNVRRETIGRLEQGQYCPSLRLAMDLAKALDTTVEDLFSFDDEE